MQFPFIVKSSVLKEITSCFNFMIMCFLKSGFLLLHVQTRTEFQDLDLLLGQL